MNTELLSLRKVKFDTLAYGDYSMFDTVSDPNEERRTGYFHRWADVERWDDKKEERFRTTVGLVEDEEGNVYEIEPSRIKFLPPYNPYHIV